MNSLRFIFTIVATFIAASDTCWNMCCDCFTTAEDEGFTTAEDEDLNELLQRAQAEMILVPNQHYREMMRMFDEADRAMTESENRLDQRIADLRAAMDEGDRRFEEATARLAQLQQQELERRQELNARMVQEAELRRQEQQQELERRQELNARMVQERQEADERKEALMLRLEQINTESGARQAELDLMIEQARTDSTQAFQQYRLAYNRIYQKIIEADRRRDERPNLIADAKQNLEELKEAIVKLEDRLKALDLPREEDESEEIEDENRRLALKIRQDLQELSQKQEKAEERLKELEEEKRQEIIELQKINRESYCTLCPKLRKLKRDLEALRQNRKELYTMKEQEWASLTQKRAELYAIQDQDYEEQERMQGRVVYLANRDQRNAEFDYRFNKIRDESRAKQAKLSEELRQASRESQEIQTELHLRILQVLLDMTNQNAEYRLRNRDPAFYRNHTRHLRALRLKLQELREIEGQEHTSLVQKEAELRAMQDQDNQESCQKRQDLLEKTKRDREEYLQGQYWNLVNN